jgi:hypothetical protein
MNDGTSMEFVSHQPTLLIGRQQERADNSPPSGEGRVLRIIAESSEPTV